LTPRIGEKHVRFKPASAAFTPDMMKQLCDTFSKAIDEMGG